MYFSLNEDPAYLPKTELNIRREILSSNPGLSMNIDKGSEFILTSDAIQLLKVLLQITMIFSNRSRRHLYQQKLSPKSATKSLITYIMCTPTTRLKK